METLALDFLNSDVRDYLGSGKREDRLADALWLEDFLRRWDLEVGSPPDAADVDRLRELRSALWRFVEALDAGRPPADSDLEALDEALSAVPFRRSVVRAENGYRLETIWPQRNWDWVRTRIASSFAELLTEWEPARLKLCSNQDCRWVYYDESKSRSRRWCADVCGNLMKVRKFRARRR